jgi:multiple sugar transport system ATP-binding protein
VAQVVYERVTKRFGDVMALAEFSLEIRDGEFIVLVGPSGSGKTTALRLLAGLEALTAGDIFIAERLVNRLAPRDRDIAMVFQDYALYPHMTVAQNMAFGLKMRKIPRDEIDRRVQHAAEMLGIGDLLRRKPKELSGGQRQRVALGRAIVREPHVFLMDEPLSNLDAKLRVQTRSEIKTLHTQVGTTTVYVTHDQVEAMTMGDRVAVMSEGVLEQVGDPRSVYERPANTFVAGFIGSPAMSLLDVNATRRNGSLLLSRGELALEVHEPAIPESGLPPAVIAGVRPEHTRLWREGAGLVGPVEGRADYVEMLGREAFIGVTASGDASFIVHAPPDVAIGPGEHVRFGLEHGRVHLFDATTKEAIAVC